MLSAYPKPRSAWRSGRSRDLEDGMLDESRKMLAQAVSSGVLDLGPVPTRGRRNTGCLSELKSARVVAAKRAFTTRRVDLGLATQIVTRCVPQAGDLLLAKVEAVGLHARLESIEGRRCRLYPDDEIIVAYGARYAPDQFEAVVPDDLGPCDLAAGGGIAGRVVSWHDRTSKPTRIVPVGLFADAEGRIINLRRFAIPVEQRPRHTPVVIAIAGTSMNSGKTTTASSLVHGLSRAGLRVSAAKVTGTGSGGDLWSLVDAGAEKVLDFTDMGYATTANLEPLEVEHVALSIINTLSSDLVDVIIIEIADGVLQKETAQLLSSPRFKSRLNGIVFAAGDAMGAGAGVRWLRERDLPIMAVSGVVTTSPLGIRETEDATGLPVLGIASLMDPVLAAKLCFSLPEAAALTAG